MVGSWNYYHKGTQFVTLLKLGGHFSERLMVYSGLLSWHYWTRTCSKTTIASYSVRSRSLLRSVDYLPWQLSRGYPLKVLEHYLIISHNGLTSCLQSLVQNLIPIELFRHLLLLSACAYQLLLGISIVSGCSLQASTRNDVSGVLICSVQGDVGITPIEIVDVDRLRECWGMPDILCSSVWLSLHRAWCVLVLFRLTLRVWKTITGL